VFTTACAACHATGAAGAPRGGDKAAWADRIAQGMDTLKQHALKGFRAMPAKGGRMDLSDAAVVAAMGYMVEQSQ
jgi:cytochrome c5